MHGILNRQVLVLNQNYHPLLVCSARRAILLVYLGKVEVIEKYRETVHSPSVVIPLPSVVKLDKFIKVKENNIVLSRKKASLSTPASHTKHAALTRCRRFAKIEILAVSPKIFAAHALQKAEFLGSSSI